MMFITAKVCHLICFTKCFTICFTSKMRGLYIAYNKTVNVISIFSTTYW